MGVLERGDRVQVETELFGWYQIRCPEGVFSYVEQKNVNAKGDGTRGEVNTDRTAVYAAHADGSKSPAESYRKLLDLERGDLVEIVGTVDNYYKIIPPQTAFVFLPPKSLTAAEAVAVADTPPASTPARKRCCPARGRAGHPRPRRARTPPSGPGHHARPAGRAHSRPRARARPSNPRPAPTSLTPVEPSLTEPAPTPGAAPIPPAAVEPALTPVPAPAPAPVACPPPRRHHVPAPG